MSHEPASANHFASLSLAQLIRLNLKRLYTWLVQLNAAGQTSVHPDYAQMVIKTEALVHAFIRSRAMAQLEAAGFFDAARAMRLPGSMRASPLDTPRIAVESAEVEPVTPAELLSRVEAMIDQFEQAESIASTLARIIVCALLYISPETQNVTVDCGLMLHQEISHVRAHVRPMRLTRRGRLPPSALDPRARPRIRDPGAPPNRTLNYDWRSNLSADTRENGYPYLRLISPRSVGGVDTSLRWCRRLINRR